MEKEEEKTQPSKKRQPRKAKKIENVDASVTAEGELLMTTEQLNDFVEKVSSKNQEAITVQELSKEDFEAIMSSEIEEVCEEVVSKSSKRELTPEQEELKRIAALRRAGKTKDTQASITRFRRRGRIPQR